MTPDPAILLRRRFLWIILLSALPILALLVFVGMREVGSARQDVLRDLQQAQAQRRDLLAQLAADVDTHTSVMRALTEQSLAEAVSLQPYAGTVDWTVGPSADPGPGRGMILADPATLTTTNRQEIAAVYPIFALARATHATRPWLRWSYYFSDSRRFVAIYPWAKASDMLDPAEATTSLAGYFTYDLYTMGQPDRNTTHTAYWSPVYVDAGGAGLMVTHAAPVWVNGQFRGIVGTDVLLSHPSGLLAALPKTAGTVMVIDQAGNLVATPDGRAASATAPQQASVLTGALDLSVTGGRFVERAGLLVSSQEIVGTPWRLVMTLPAQDLQSAAAGRSSLIALIIALVIAALALVGFVLDRQFVTPAMALADYGTRPSAEIVKTAPPVNLPSVFRPLVERITEAARLRFAQTVQLRAMVDGVPLRVVYLDADLIYRDANREFLTFMGLSSDDLIGRHVRDVLGADVERQYLGIAPLMARGEIGRFDGWIAYKDQGERYLQVAILPFTAPGEERPGYLTFTRDLTELKAAEQASEAQRAALAEREELFRAVVVSALDAIVVMDDQGIAREFNPAAQAIFGYTAAEAVGQKVADLIVPPEAHAAHSHGMDRYLASGEPHVIGKRIEVEAMRKGGARLPVELTVTEMLAGGRRLFVSHLRDMTEAKRLDREMRDGRERLHQVEKLSAMGSLLAGVAHELNNPLAIAVAQSTLLVERAESPDVRNRAERIRAAADRCGRIVKSFLAMARQKPPHREAMDLAEAVEAALEVVGYGLRSAGIQISRDLAGLPPINGDRDLLGQVFSNLLINAQQVLTTRTLPRRIDIRGWVEGEFVVLQIADNGPGVPEAIRTRIFEPYFTTKAVEVGTGIGLSISRNVIEGHGGSISLVPGTADLPGACFEIRLPVAPPLPAAAADAASQPLRPLRALIVDDEPDVAEVLGEILESDGHQIVLEGSAEAALARLAALPGASGFDVIFTDLRMPGMDGADLALAVARDHPGLADRVVLMTGDSVAGPDHAARKGLVDPLILEKPFLPKDVRALLKTLFGGSA